LVELKNIRNGIIRPIFCDVPLSNLLKDKFYVLKSNGQKSHTLKVSVQRKGIYLMRAEILVEVNDLIQRVMSNGETDTFLIIDPGFHEGTGRSIPAHYQMKVKKLGLSEAEKAVLSITSNISDPNARVNKNATDYSNNVVNIKGILQRRITN